MVCRLSVAPVKGTRLQTVEQVTLDRFGAQGDRRFFVIDGRGRMVNGKAVGELCRVVATLAGEQLTLQLPDGSVVSAPVELGQRLRTRFFSRTVEADVLQGPFAQALSEVGRQPLRLVQGVRRAVDRGASGGVSLVSSRSLARLAAQAGAQSVDSRRFRMLVEVDGVEAHAEDGWVRRRMRLGEAEVRFGGHVGRCLVTSRDPDSGHVDLPTLDLLREYRGQVAATEPLPLGIYGQVLTTGTVRVGDEVTVLR